MESPFRERRFPFILKIRPRDLLRPYLPTVDPGCCGEEDGVSGRHPCPFCLLHSPHAHPSFVSKWAETEFGSQVVTVA